MTIEALVSDFDGTLVPLQHVGGLDDTAAFATAWRGLADGERPLFVANSGRMADDLAAALVRFGLPEPDYLIGGVGTQVCDRRGEALPGYHAYLGEFFDVGEVESVVARLPDVRRQEDAFQSRYKSSWYWDGASDEELSGLAAQLGERGLDVTIVYSSRRDLDILPKRADKGKAVRWLAAELGLSRAGLVVAGDSGNDSRMFTIDGVRGIVVGNAHGDLRHVARESGNDIYEAPAPAAAGVVQGLRHFGLDLPATEDAHARSD